LGGFGGQDENARADDGADAKQGQLQRPEAAMQAFFLGGGKNVIKRFDAPKNHVSLPKSEWWRAAGALSLPQAIQAASWFS
jgi:hypothetical protein